MPLSDLHHTLEIDLVDGQAALAGAASRTNHAAIDHRADKGIAPAGRLICASALRFWLPRGFFWFSTAICCLGCACSERRTCCTTGLLAFGALAGLAAAAERAAGWAAEPSPYSPARRLSGMVHCLLLLHRLHGVPRVLDDVGVLPQAVPAAIPMKRIPVVSFIGPLPLPPRAGPVFRPLPLGASCHD